MQMKTYLYVNALSSLGSRMDLIACSALIFTFEHSAFWLTAFFVARQVGGILFSPIAGVLADRMDRRRVMIASDVGAGLAVLSIVLFPHPLVVVAAAFVKGMLYSLFHISFQSSLPQMFGREDLLRINGWTVRLESLVGIVGFALGGFLTDHAGYLVVIACDAATFLLSAAVLTRMRWESDEKCAESADALTDAPVRVSEERSLRATIPYLAKQPILLVISLLALFESLSTSAHNYGLPFLAEQLSSKDAALHGVMWSTMSLGAMVGSFLATRWSARKVEGMFAASMLLALVVTAAFAGGEMARVLLLLAGAGLFAGAAQVYESTLLQQADNQIRGRVMGVQSLLSRTGFFVGFVMAPSLTAWLGLYGMVAMAQLVFSLGLLGLGWFYLRKR
ncbi:arabinose ABC transporter permease [Brevibacillus choshinensis]|uniref:Arabinose ABC transporter permease n=1 Tax=Brevibacillus choshinensis TaxID=54911 RepID=A0ABR5N9F9_BRECH|nr:arabinose ABC transporter permease [Brevibacillus choshinensis]